MKRVFCLYGLFLLLMLVSCSPTVLLVSDDGGVEEEHYKFLKNGDFVCKKYTLGIIRKHKPARGRYIVVNDSLYLVSKTGKGSYEYYARGFIDSASNTLHFQFNDWKYWRNYAIVKLLYLQLYRTPIQPRP